MLWSYLPVQAPLGEVCPFLWGLHVLMCKRRGLWWFTMSAWLGHRTSRHLVKRYFCVCLYGCFQKKSAFELDNWVEQSALPCVGGWHQLTPQGPEWGKKKSGERREGFSPFAWLLSWDIHLLCSGLWLSRFKTQTEIYTIGCLGFPVCRQQTVGCGTSQPP